MYRNFVLSFTTTFLLLSACGEESDAEIQTQKNALNAALTDGSVEPPQTWDLSQAKQNSVVRIEGSRTTCSGIWIKDRIVLTAFHCVIENGNAWGLDGAAPIFGEPESYVVHYGASLEPLCSVGVQEIVAADAMPRLRDLGIIETDLALMVLDESPFDACFESGAISDAALPLDLPDESEFEGLVGVGDTLLIAGFGSSFGAPINPRSFGEVEVESNNPAPGDVDISRFLGDAVPGPGDSGGLVAARDSTGRTVLAGVISSVVPPRMAYVAVAKTQGFWSEASGDAFFECPLQSARCFENVSVVCEDGSYTTNECEEGCNEGACVDAVDDVPSDAAMGCASLGATHPSIAIFALLLHGFVRRHRCRSGHS